MIADERLRELYQYWLAKCGDRALPSRSDLDPMELPGALWPHIMILDVVRDGDRLRFRYRRMGMVFAEAFGQDTTGRFMDEVLPERGGYRHFVAGLYEELIRRRRPMYSENLFMLDGQSVPMLTKRVSLPLSKDGETIDMVFTGHVFEYHRSLEGAIHPRVSGCEELVRLVL